MLLPKPAPLSQNLPAGANQFIERLAELPGEASALLVFADWLDENDRATLAAAVRTRTPKLAKHYALCVELLDAFLSVNVAGARPVPMPAPDRPHGGRGQLVALVRAALRPYRLPGLSVARAAGWWTAYDLTIGLPNPTLAFTTGDPTDGGFIVPWPVGPAELLEAAGMALGALMPALFPGEPLRVGYTDGDTFITPFWTVGLRPAL